MCVLRSHMVFALWGALFLKNSHGFGVFPQRQISARPRVQVLRMHFDPVSIILAADSTPSLSDLAQQAPDVIGAAADLADLAGAASGLADVAGAASGLADVAGAAQASVGESLGSIGNFWGSIVDSVSSAKDQVTDTTLGSVGALKSQVGELGANALSPFQRLGEDLSSSLTGGLDSLKTGAQGAVTKNIGSPLEEGLGRIFSNFGTSPEELLKEEETWANGVQQVVTQIEGVATPSRVFYAENAFILPFWLGMIVWPEEKLTKQVISSYLPVVAAAVVYTWLTYECFQNPVSLQGFASGITNFPVLRQGFGEEVSVATAWSHFLAEDLFIGRFVYLDGQKNKVFTRHSLLLCYLFGPVGFLSHMLTRGAVGVVKPVRDIMEAGIGQQPTKVSPKSPPATKAASPISSPVPSTEAVELVAKAKREAEEILKEARSAGASLLEDAERDSLLILKGAEVEKEALLQSNKPETTAKIEGAATEAESDGAATKTKAKPAKTGPAAT